MTTSAILKAIHALPRNEQMKIVEKVIHSLRVEAPAKKPTTAKRTVKRKANPDNPSPSGDPWFDDPRNVAIVMDAIKKSKKGKCVTIEESPTLSKIFAKYSAKYSK